MNDLKSEFHQHAPSSGEQYDAYRRLQNYALVTGFAIVIAKKGRIEYVCVQHGNSGNTRRLSLEDRKWKTKSRAKDGF